MKQVEGNSGYTFVILGSRIIPEWRKAYWNEYLLNILVFRPPVL